MSADVRRWPWGVFTNREKTSNRRDAVDGNRLFDKHAAEWLAGLGKPLGSDPMEVAISKAKRQILRDVRFGRVPPTVRSFAELHDYVDANGYGNAFDWPVLPSETDDDTYQQRFVDFWNFVQDRLSDWIANGEMREAARSTGRYGGRD
jgi:hypothetical protein